MEHHDLPSFITTPAKPARHADQRSILKMIREAKANIADPQAPEPNRRSALWHVGCALLHSVSQEQVLLHAPTVEGGEAVRLVKSYVAFELAACLAKGVQPSAALRKLKRLCRITDGDVAARLKEERALGYRFAAKLRA